MKTLKSIFIVSVLFFLSISCGAQRRVFNEFQGRKDITTIYISSPLTKLGLNFAANDKDFEKIKKCIRNPQGIEIVTSEKEEGRKSIRNKLEKIIRENNMEVFLDTDQDEEEKVTIYTGPVLKDNVMKDMIIEVSDGNDYVVMYFFGEFDLNNLNN